MKIEFSPFAVADLSDIRDWIERDDELTAARIVSRIRQSVTILGQYPLLGHVGSVRGTREFKVGGLPYFIVYRVIRGEAVIVLNIIHGRQNYPPS